LREIFYLFPLIPTYYVNLNISDLLRVGTGHSHSEESTPEQVRYKIARLRPVRCLWRRRESSTRGGWGRRAAKRDVRNNFCISARVLGPEHV